MMEKPAAPKAPKETKPEAPAVAPPPYTPPAASGPSAGPGGLAIAALIVGIVAILSCFIPFWGLAIGITAVVLGIIAAKKPAGKGFGITGIVLGGLSTLINLIFIAFVVVALFAAGTVANEARQAVDESRQEAKQAETAKKDFTKGETGKFGSFEVKVNSVRRDYVPENEFSRASDGKELIVVNLTVKNTSDEAKSVSAFDFSINDNGIATSNSYVDVAPELPTGELSVGASTTGNIVYEVTKSASGLKLQYREGVFDFGSDKAYKEYDYTLAI